MDSFKKSLAMLTIAIFLAPLAFPLSSSQATSKWDIQPLDVSLNIGNPFCPIALDANNQPHIVYTQVSGSFVEDN
jgi:hypothetical protein